MINRCDLMLQYLKHFKTVIMSSYKSVQSVQSVQGVQGVQVVRGVQGVGDIQGIQGVPCVHPVILSSCPNVHQTNFT